MYGTSMVTKAGKVAFRVGKPVASHTANLGRTVAGAGKQGAAEGAFGKAAGAASGTSAMSENNNESSNDNLNQDVGASMNNDEQNNTNSESNSLNSNDEVNQNQDANQSESVNADADASKGASSEQLDGNVNASGVGKNMNDESVASTNPDKAKEDTLNGLDPMNGTSSGMDNTSKMDADLDNKNEEMFSSNSNSRGVLNKEFSFGNNGKTTTDNNVKGSSKSGSSSNDFSSGNTSGTRKNSSIGNNVKHINHLDKQVFNESKEGDK